MLAYTGNGLEGVLPLLRTVTSPRALRAHRRTDRRPVLYAAGGIFLAVTLTVAVLNRNVEQLAPMPVQAPNEVAEEQLPLIDAPWPGSYIVEDGDTLFGLGFELDTSVDALAMANGLDDLNFLHAGDELVVPPPGSARQPTDPALTLTEVAATYRLDPAILAIYNNVPPDLVHLPIAREALLFPPGAIPLAMAYGDQSGEAALFGSIPFGAERASEPFVYRVRPGDTLTDVAWRLGIDVDTIVNNNRTLRDADVIRIGQEILVLPISGMLYTVQGGDTLPRIAERFQIELGPILEYNSLDEDSAITAGMDLVLPGAGPTYAAPRQPGTDRILVPYRSQLDRTPWAGANCGPTSLGMGLESLGIKVSSTELRRQVLNAQGMWGNNVGTLMDALARVATSQGARPIGLYDGDRISRWTMDDVRGQLRQGRPVIVQVRFRALPGRAGIQYYGDHYIILTGLSGESFLYNDPLDSDGPGANRLMTAAQLDAAMNASDSRYAHAAFALAR